MKKNILILACISTTFIHAMETAKKYFSITYYGTIINVTQDSSFEAGDKVNLIVVGKNQQLKYQRPKSNKDSLKVGQTMYPKRPIIYEQNNKKVMTCLVMNIVEPILIYDGYYSAKTKKTEYGYFYHFITKNTAKHPTAQYGLSDNEALTTASQHLVLCYNHALNTGLKNLRLKKIKSIALPILCQGQSFPWETAASIGINTILSFVEKNPSAYDRIELFVPEQLGFTLYTNQLAQIKKMYFLYCVQQNILSNMPFDIRNFIMKLLWFISNSKNE